MTGKRAGTKKGAGGVRARKTVEGILEGKPMMTAAIEAGYSPVYAKSHLYHSETAKWIHDEVERRQREAMKKAAVHTDVIVGHLVEIATASISDVLDDNGDFDIQKARASGVDHLIKRLKKTKRTDKNGTTEVCEVELYSRLEAISQLRDNFGMKQEPRANTFEESRRQEVEREIDKIAAAEGCDRAEAAVMLRDALGEDSPLIATVNKYVH